MDARLSYREAAVRGASPIRLVILLYEQAIADLGKAAAAHRHGDIAGRTKGINHAILVLGHLQASLNKERGGKVAENLGKFYSQIRSSLVNAQCRQSVDAIQQQISLLMIVHEAWCEVERINAGQANSPASSTKMNQDRSVTKWKA